jgi:hypothetical protein
VSVTNVAASPTVVTAGNSTDIEVTVQNRKETAAKQTVRLRLFGEVVNGRTITVPANDKRTVTFSHQIVEPGTYTARSGDESTEINVRGTNSSSTPSSSGASSSLLPGLGAGIGVLALVVFALVTVFSLRQSDWRQ